MVVSVSEERVKEVADHGLYTKLSLAIGTKAIFLQSKE